MSVRGGKKEDVDDERRVRPNEGQRSDRNTYGHVPRKCCEEEEETGKKGQKVKSQEVCCDCAVVRLGWCSLTLLSV